MLSEIMERNENVDKYLEISGILIVVLNAEGKIIFVNKKLCNLLGYKNKEIIGKSWFEMCIPKKEKNSVKKVFNKVSKGDLELFVKYENSILTKKGKLVHINWYNSYLIDDAGRIIKIISFGMDITEQKITGKIIKKSELKYRRLFESAQDGILIIDAVSGKIMDVNPFLISMLSYTKEEFIGKSIWEISPFKDIITNQNKFRELQKQKYVRYDDLPLETKDGTKKHVEFVSNVYNVSDKKIIQCNIRDIEDRVNAEKKAQKVKSLSDDIKNMELINQTKTEFLNIVSHELKTPLTAIFANIELLEDITGKIPKANILNIESLKRNGNQLKLIIDNILEISRLQSNMFELNITKVHLEKIIMSVIDEINIVAKIKNIDLTTKLDKLPILKTDEKRLIEILDNLLSNAIKFTSKGFVELIAKKEGKSVLISVTDTGIGIAKDKQAGIFQKFYQADSSIKRAYGGSGLGLSIVKKLVEALGGEVGFKSEVNKGSTFFFTLPLKMEEGKNEKNTLCRGS